MNSFHSQQKHMFRSSNIRSDRHVLRFHFPRPDIAKRPKSLAAISLAELSRDMRRIEVVIFGIKSAERYPIKRSTFEKPSGTDHARPITAQDVCAIDWRAQAP